ncbi:MAG: hypothetical protein HYT87_17670 [Nitrospirae bacterium]|nr:hypothetical protein [Nitrospirota bacterium]
MHAAEFLASLARASTLKRVYFFFGEESYFFRIGLGELKKRFLPDIVPAVEHVKFDFSLTRMLAHLTTTGLWSGKRMALLYGAESLAKKDHKTLGEYCGAPAPDSLLIIRDEGWEVPSWLKAGANVEVVQCKPVRGADLGTWVDRLLTEHGVRLDPEARDWLIDRAGNSLTEIDQCARRISWVQSEATKPLGIEDIRDCVADTAERTAYQLGEAVVRRQAPAALLSLEKLIEWADSPLMVIGGLAGYVRREIAPPKNAWRSSGPSISGEEGLRLLSILAKLDSEVKSSRLSDAILMRRALFSLLETR